jgi:hypothetical protein
MASPTAANSAITASIISFQFIITSIAYLQWFVGIES